MNRAQSQLHQCSGVYPNLSKVEILVVILFKLPKVQIAASEAWVISVRLLRF